MKTRALFAAAILLTAGAASAATVKKMFVVEAKSFPFRDGGVVVIENPVGNVEITGSDDNGVVTAEAFKMVSAVDDDWIEEGRRQTNLIVGGDEKTRVFRTTIPMMRAPQWTSSVTWRITAPRSAHLRVLSNTSDHIRVTNIQGNVFVKNFAGSIALDNLSGTISVESVNGSILYKTQQPQAHVRLATVNGNIMVKVPPSADFRWVAETVKGDITTNLPARGTLIGATFRGSVNAPGGPTLTTATLTGNVTLLSTATTGAAAVQSLRTSPLVQKMAIGAPNAITPAGLSPQGTKQAVIEELRWKYVTNIGDVEVEQIRGDAEIFTGAGAVRLGSVGGALNVVSRGGPLHLGQINGPVTATTRAGDVFVDSARRGGTIATRGGTIRLNYAGGSTRLVSGGGDITVAQASAPINAETRSGDISITVDPAAKSQRITAETDKGNIVLYLGAGFGADVEATIVTTDANAHAVVSDFPGLSIQREPVGSRIRIRAIGKLNGGGEKVVLEAADGGIKIVNSGARR